MNGESLHHFPFDFSHHFDDEEDIRFKSIAAKFLFGDSKSEDDVAKMLDYEFQPWDHVPQPEDADASPWTRYTGYTGGAEDMFMLIAKNIPFDHPAQDRLIVLIKAMRRVPEREGRPVWRTLFEGELPGLLHEAYCGGQDIGCDLGNPDNEVGREQWRNFNAFEARLLRDGICKPALHADYAFSQALNNSAEHELPDLLDLKVLVACGWLELAGQAIFTARYSRPEGRRETTREDWESRKVKFQEIAADPTRGDSAREAAQKAHRIVSDLLGSSLA